MKRLAVVLCLVFAAFGGAAIGTGHGTALADDSGTGSGTANACARHATNDGNSYAYGLTCARISLTVTNNGPGDFTITITGEGLLPGSTVTICSAIYPSTTYRCGTLLDYGNGDQPVIVGQDGTFSFSSGIYCGRQQSLYFIGTAANGSTYTSPTYPLVTTCSGT